MSIITYKINNHRKYFSFNHKTGDLFVDKVALQNLYSLDEINYIIYITLSDINSIIPS